MCLFVVYCNFGRIDFRKMEPPYFRVNPGLVKKCCSDPFLHSCPVYLRGVLTATADVSLVEDKEFLLSPPLETWPLDLKGGATGWEANFMAIVNQLPPLT